MNSLATLRWNHGGLKVSCIASQRGGKITKSSQSTPGVALVECSTRKIDGSGWSKLTEPMVLKRRRSYLQGALLPCQATTSSGEGPMRAVHSPPANLATSSKSPSRSSYQATGV